jgi:hypothetical protein
MGVVEAFDEKIVQIGDILEQIASLNRRIAFHRQNNGDASTISQYEYLRERLTTELSELLRAYQLEARISVMAP